MRKEYSVTVRLNGHQKEYLDFCKRTWGTTPSKAIQVLIDQALLRCALIVMKEGEKDEGKQTLVE